MAAKYERDLDEATSGLADLSLPVTVLSWNINGYSERGNADARRRMIDSVISHIDPDVMLLQETKNSLTDPKKVSSLVNYNSVHAGNKEEAQVFYKKNDKFEIVSPSTAVNSKLDNILKEMFLKDKSYQLRSGLSPQEDETRKRTCVVHLRHKLTKREIIFISYHNFRKGGGLGAVKKRAKEFCQIIAKLHESTKCCVIAGVDFNCNDFDSRGVTVPEYEATLRRQIKEKAKIDFFILKNPPVDCDVEAFDLFPENKEAPFYKILQSLLQHNTEEEYKKANDHDPLQLTMKIR